MLFFNRQKSKSPFERRYEDIVYLTTRHTATLKNFLDTPPSKRQWGLKPDGSEITRIDYTIGLKSFTYISGRYPEDSINSEEIPMLRPAARWEFHEDPVDVTSHARKYDKSKPLEYPWAAYMASYTEEGQSCMFGLGIPARHERFHGSIKHGFFRNGIKFEIDRKKESRLVIGMNEDEYIEALQKDLNRTSAFLAVCSAWLALHRAAGAGVHLAYRSYEVSCILAIARINGAKITDENGNDFRTHTNARFAIWSYPHIDHQELLKQVKEKFMPS